MPTTPANLTPYDTGDVLEPKVWPTTPDTPERFGYVDFENDSGETQFTVRIVPTDNGHRLEIDNYRSGALDVRIIQ